MPSIFIFSASVSALFLHYKNTTPSGKTSPLFYTSVVAENGQRSKVILPDSSVVWLNAGTQISYNSDFGNLNSLI